MAIEIVEVSGPDSFGLIPPCADARFDHRTCDYWEDAERGSKASRPALLEARPIERPRQPSLEDNPFAPARAVIEENPFAPAGRAAVRDPFGDEDFFRAPPGNPFAPMQARERPLREGVPRKLALLDRGRGIFGSYAKVLLADGHPQAYCQFGPLS